MYVYVCAACRPICMHGCVLLVSNNVEVGADREHTGADHPQHCYDSEEHPGIQILNPNQVLQALLKLYWSIFISWFEFDVSFSNIQTHSMSALNYMLAPNPETVSGRLI